MKKRCVKSVWAIIKAQFLFYFVFYWPQNTFFLTHYGELGWKNFPTQPMHTPNWGYGVA